MAEPMWSAERGPWKRVAAARRSADAWRSPERAGLYHAAMDKHTAYLLADSNIDDMVFRFRKLAGIANPPGSARDREGMFPAPRGPFLIGAGNTLRWGETAELRRRSNQACRRLGSTAHFRRKVGRALRRRRGRLFLHAAGAGLEAAARVGNHDAYDLLNAWAAWYRATGRGPHGMNPPGADRTELLRRHGMMIDYFSPGGKPEDVHTAYYHVYPEWMRNFASNLERHRTANGYRTRPTPTAGWATGHVSRHRRPASTGGGVGRMGNVSHHWQHPGGSLAICESDVYPPDSLYVTAAAILAKCAPWLGGRSSIIGFINSSQPMTATSLRSRR